MTHERRLAEAYYKLLTSLDWTDQVLICGLREGLNKFVSNAFLGLMPRINKYHRTHLVSDLALAQMSAGNYQGLIYEHLVPKTRYIQRPCEELAAKGELTVEFVEDLLVRYWRIATITKKEDSRLHRTKMPDEWDGIDLVARYSAVGIELQPNPYFPVA